LIRIRVRFGIVFTVADRPTATLPSAPLSLKFLRVAKFALTPNAEIAVNLILDAGRPMPEAAA
jgi:hypothetical protein